tara:strand:+ start:846 stop:1919 length:1074 start_codon:yes stop_codon:yes gene_type:complete
MRKITNIFLILLLIGCANIVVPTGGEKDIEAPRVLSVEMTENNKQNKIVTFEFDEYIQLNKWEKNFFVSPPIKNSIQKNIRGYKLILTIEGKLAPLTHYLSLNYCIKDNNEGNILDELEYKLSTNGVVDTLTLSGNLRDAYTLRPLENTWIMLFNSDVNDTVIFNSMPEYISKTDTKGFFYFPNLKDKYYKIVAVTEDDFTYDKEEKIAFLDSVVNAKTDSFISLFAFDPLDTIHQGLIDTIPLKIDSIILDSTPQKEDIPSGSLQIIFTEEHPCIFQLIQNDKVKIEASFNKFPYLFDNIPPGNYALKYIIDSNKDSLWSTGNWEKRMQPEKTLNYPSEIMIRSNWDLELDWTNLE